ncbi:MAG: hypothetical protein SFU85_05340 [Candidatus Methylacidiphilales bacterium]|nr:hypothetical protein [Candidatus Methylacidiphilales bacterium]
MMAPVLPSCRIHEHLETREVERIKRLLGRISWGLGNPIQARDIDDETVLSHCPYMKPNGPSQLCTHACHLHHLVFAESWP